MEKPKRDLAQEQEDLIRILEVNVDEEVKEAIQIALSALPNPTQPNINYSTEGAFDASPQRNC